MTKLKPDRLLALGAERLTELLMELTDRDVAIEKRLVMLTATNSEALKKVRAQISGLKRTKRFYDWRSIGKLREKIELAIRGLGQLEIEPAKGFELVCGFYETDNAVYGNCDDSSGTIADLYKYDAPTTPENPRSGAKWGEWTGWFWKHISVTSTNGT